MVLSGAGTVEDEETAVVEVVVVLPVETLVEPARSGVLTCTSADSVPKSRSGLLSHTTAAVAAPSNKKASAVRGPRAFLILLPDTVFYCTLLERGVKHALKRKKSHQCALPCRKLNVRYAYTPTNTRGGGPSWRLLAHTAGSVAGHGRA